MQGTSNIECYSLDHALVAVLTIIGTAANLALKIVATKLVTFIPDHSFEYAEKGMLENIKTCTYFILLLSQKIVFHLGDGDHESLRLIHIGAIGCLVILLSLQIFLRGFYSQWAVERANIQLCIGIFGLASFLVPLEFNIHITETTYYVLCSILYTIVFRCGDNYARNRKVAMLRGWSNNRLQLASIYDISEVYYYLVELIHTTLADVKDGNQDRRICYLFFGKYLQRHKLKCKLLTCPCMKKVVPYEFDPLGVIDRELPIREWLAMCLFVLSDFLKHLSIQNSSEELSCMLPYFEATYKGQLSSAYSLITNNKHSFQARNKKTNESIISINQARVIDLICESCRDNVRYAELGMSKLIRSKDLITKERNKVDSIEYFEFLDEFQMFKNDISECLDLRVNYLNEILSTGKLIKAHSISEKFSKLCFKINKKYRVLKEKSPVLYSPLMLVYGEFLFFIFQNISQGRKTLIEYNKIAGFTKIFLPSIKTDHELCLVYAYLKNNSIGEISYITANLVKMTGFRRELIEDGGIEFLIPEPIKSIHHEFFSAGNQGSLLQNPNLSENFCNTVNGIVEIMFNVRHSMSILRGVEFISCICFSETYHNNQILLIDRSGTICSLNQSAKWYFKEGDLVEDYNKELLLRIRTMQKFLEITNSQNSNKQKIEDIIATNQIEESVIYYKSQHYLWYEIKSSRGKKFNMRIKFEKKLYRSNFFNFWILRISDVEEIEKNIPEWCEEDQKQSENKTENWEAGKLATCILGQERYQLVVENVEKPEQGFTFFEVEKNAIPEEIEKEVELDPIERVKDYSNTEFNQMREIAQAKIQTKTRVLGKKSLSKAKVPLITSSLAKKSSNKVIPMNYNDQQLPHFSKIARKFNRSSFENYEASNNIKDNSWSNLSNSLHDKSKRNDGLLEMNIDTSVKSSMNENDSKINRISVITHSYIVPDRIHFPVVVTSIILFVLLAASILLVLVKVPIQQNTNLEVKEQAITLDFYSKEIWGFTQTLIILERFRFMKEGLMSVVMELRPDKPIRYRLIQNYFRESCNLIQQYNLYISDKAARVSNRNLFDYSKWSSMEFKIQDYRIDSTNRVVWSTDKMDKNTAISKLSARMRNFCTRDYENDTLPLLGPDRNRDLDPEEEFMRRNLIGNPLDNIIQGNIQFGDYLQNLSEKNKNYIIWTLVASLIVSLMIVLILLLYIVQEIKSMHYFYKTIYKIKVNQVLIIRERYYKRSQTITTE